MICDMHVRVKTPGAILAGAFIWLSVGCGAKTEQSAPSVESVASAMEELKQEVKQQTAVLHRALGKQIPVVIPADLETALKSLEDVFASETLWPSSGDAARELQRRVAQLLHQIPPWAEEDVLPRLNSIRWSADVLVTIRANENTPADSLEDVEALLDSLTQAAPDNAPPRLREYLANRRERTSEALLRYRQDNAVQAAKDALQGRGDVQVAWTGLEAIEADEQIKTLRRDLRCRITEETARQRLSVIRVTLDKAKGCDDDDLRNIALTRVYDAATGVLLDLMIEEPCPASALAEARSVTELCRKQLAEAGLRQRGATERRVRDYQAWALKRIRDFDGPKGWQYEVTLPWVRQQLAAFKNAEEPVEWILLQQFPSVRALLEETLELDLSDVKGSLLTAEKQEEIYTAAYARIGWKKNVDQEIAYRTTRDGIVTFLLPINPSLLDPPVAQLYQKAFTKAWEKLDSRANDQLYVAEQAAVVKKQSIE